MAFPKLPQTLECLVCEKKIISASITSPHPESPAFFFGGGAWIGTFGESIETLRIIACCSETCVQRFLEAGDAAMARRNN